MRSLKLFTIDPTSLATFPLFMITKSRLRRFKSLVKGLLGNPVSDPRNHGSGLTMTRASMALTQTLSTHFVRTGKQSKCAVEGAAVAEVMASSHSV